LLKEAADQRGLISKPRGHAPGRSFTRGHLYQLLSNPIYIGDVRHRDDTYPGQHEAIIDRATWDAVQQQLSENQTNDRSTRNASTSSLLTGLVHDETGDRLSPTHANKKGRRYRYYISQRLVHDAHRHEGGWRLPARELESTVIATIAAFLKDPPRVIETLQLINASPEKIKIALRAASAVANVIIDGHSEQQRHRLIALVDRIVISPDSLRIEMRRSTLWDVVPPDPSARQAASGIVPLDVPIRLKRRGVEAKLIVRSPMAETQAPNRNLTGLVAQAHSWLDALVNGEIGSVRGIAQRDGVDPSDVGRILQLAFLAPDIVEDILAGREPIELTAKRLKRIGRLPLDWREQRRALGFTG
jgi:hypothetical protein